MESSAGASKPNKGLWVKLAILVVVVGLAGLAVLRGVDVRELIDYVLETVRGAGPLAFFTGMAVLPAFGFPLSPFTLSAGSVFAPTMGWPFVLAATWLALSINVTLTYVAARWVARPWLEKLVLRFGYHWPQVKPDGYWDITILLRVTPGPPFFVQSALLGLAQVPLRIYLIGSVIIGGLYGTAFVIFGEALLSGKGRMVLIGAGAIAGLAVGTQLLRRHYARKRKALGLVEE